MSCLSSYHCFYYFSAENPTDITAVWMIQKAATASVIKLVDDEASNSGRQILYLRCSEDSASDITKGGY